MNKQPIMKSMTDEEIKEMEIAAAKEYDSDIVKDSFNKWNSYSKQKQQSIINEDNSIYQEFKQAIPQGANSTEAQSIVEKWRKHMSYF